MTVEQEMHYRFVVTPLGEPVRSTGENVDDEQVLVGGGVNVGNVAQQVLSPTDYGIYAEFDRSSTKWKAVSRYVDRCVQHQFCIDAYEGLSLPEFDFYCRICDLQRLNNSRFRIWGEMHADSFDAEERKAWLAAEFVWWVDDRAYWPMLQELADKCRCETIVMHEEPHVDQRWPQELVQSGVVLNDTNVVFGENHGRLERQVEFRCNIYGWSEEVVRRRLTELADRTEEVWRRSGVNVL